MVDWDAGIDSRDGHRRLDNAGVEADLRPTAAGLQLRAAAGRACGRLHAGDPAGMCGENPAVRV